MSFVAVAIGGSAVVGAGASIYAADQMAGAAKKGSNAQQDAMLLGINTQQAGKREALSYLDPVRQYGLNAGATLQSMLYSPRQLDAQQASQEARLQGEIDKIQAQSMTFDQWRAQYGAQYTGGKGLKRSRGAYAAYSGDINQRLKDAQSNLATYTKQADIEQESGLKAGDIQASPWYEFQSTLLGRNMDRLFSARGLTGSGFEAEENRVGQLQLGATETENQFNRLFSMYGTGANASAQGAGAITGTAQNVANLQVGVGQAQAQGYQGVAGANANAAMGVANSVTGAVGAGLNYAQFKNLMARNTGPTPTGTVRDPVMGTGYNTSGGDTSYSYLRPVG